jgi:hypothetical protein
MGSAAGVMDVKTRSIRMDRRQLITEEPSGEFDVELSGRTTEINRRRREDVTIPPDLIAARLHFFVLRVLAASRQSSYTIP